MNKKTIIQTTILIVSLMIWTIVFVYATNMKQEPIQQILNQIEANDSELKKLEEQQNLLNQQNEEAKARLMNEFWLQMIQSSEENHKDPESSEEVADERMPWKLSDDWTHQEMPAITWSDSHERFKELATAYWLDASQIRAVENHYWITEWVILCITIAETSWWNRWYWWKNIWSVWSNDRWDRPTYALMESWLEDIWKTLNNRYLWSKKTLWCLSNAWSCKEADDNWKRYATSDWNRERNMTACLSTIYWTINASEFNIRR